MKIVQLLVHSTLPHMPETKYYFDMIHGLHGMFFICILSNEDEIMFLPW